MFYENFFAIFLTKNLVVSKKSSNFAAEIKNLRK